MNTAQNSPAESSLVWPKVPSNLNKVFPPVMVAIIKALGISRTITLGKLYGGVQFYCSKHKNNKINLSKEELQRLQISLQLFVSSDNKIYFPKIDKLFIQARNERIISDKNMLSITELAIKYKLSSRQILHIQKNHIHVGMTEAVTAEAESTGGRHDD